MNVKSNARRFTCESAASLYIAKCRGWERNSVFPKCGSHRVTWLYDIGQGFLLLCNACRRKSSVRTGTAMERSRLRLTTWLRAIRIVAFSRDVNPSVLHRTLGLGSYHTAMMLHDCLLAVSRSSPPHPCDRSDPVPWPDGTSDDCAVLTDLFTRERRSAWKARDFNLPKARAKRMSLQDGARHLGISRDCAYVVEDVGKEHSLRDA